MDLILSNKEKLYTMHVPFRNKVLNDNLDFDTSSYQENHSFFLRILDLFSILRASGFFGIEIGIWNEISIQENTVKPEIKSKICKKL